MKLMDLENITAAAEDESRWWIARDCPIDRETLLELIADDKALRKRLEATEEIIRGYRGRDYGRGLCPCVMCKQVNDYEAKYLA